VARCAISGAATWRFPSISRRLMLSAQAAGDRVQRSAGHGPRDGRVHGPQPHPAACGKLATRDANRASYASARTLPPGCRSGVPARLLRPPRSIDRLQGIRARGRLSEPVGVRRQRWPGRVRVPGI
jgi:hypothetical protein